MAHKPSAVTNSVERCGQRANRSGRRTLQRPAGPRRRRSICAQSHGQMSLIVNPFGEAGDHFGASVALDSVLYAVVAARRSSVRRIIRKPSLCTCWSIRVGHSPGNRLTAGASGHGLGTSAAISGRTVLMGAPFDQNGTVAGCGSARLL